MCTRQLDLTVWHVLAAFVALTSLGCSSQSPGEGNTPPEDASVLSRSVDAGAGTHDASFASESADAGSASSVAIDPMCGENGCLRAATRIGGYGADWIRPYLEPGVSIDNGYTVWTIRYATHGRESLATVTIPLQLEVPNTAFSIVGNNHGTTGIDDPCAISGTVYAAGLAGLFGARGMIGVATDYPGLGTTGLHPYLVSEVEGAAALDALRAAHALAQWLGIPTTEHYAMVGLSQGGHATLAAAAMHRAYAPELDIRAFSVSAPAAVWENHWRSAIQVDGSHVSGHAMMFYAWADYYHYVGPTLWADGMESTLNSAMHSLCYVALPSTLGSRADQLFSAGFLDAYRTGHWGSYAAAGEWFAKNEIQSYDQTAPLRIYQGADDTTVLPWMTDQLVAALRDGGVEVDYQVVEGGIHTNVAWGPLASDELRTTESLTWIQGQLSR